MISFLRRKFYSTLIQGEGFSKRIYLLNHKNEKISPWKDVPLVLNETKGDIFNAFIEIPRYSLAKLEIAKDEDFHPVKQDIRKNKQEPNVKELRYYPQFGSFNYGCFPQTWENSILPNKEVDNLLGDDDPLDLIELSDTQFRNPFCLILLLATGTIVPIKVFGVLALIDQGEIDWKVVTLNQKEAEEKNINTLEDLEKAFPHRMSDIIRWFKFYKTFDGKKPNTIHFDEKILDKKKAIEIIHENNKFWKELKEVIQNPSKFQSEYGRKLLDKAKNFKL